MCSRKYPLRNTLHWLHLSALWYNTNHVTKTLWRALRIVDDHDSWCTSVCGSDDSDSTEITVEFACLRVIAATAGRYRVIVLGNDPRGLSQQRSLLKPLRDIGARAPRASADVEVSMWRPVVLSIAAITHVTTSTVLKQAWTFVFANNNEFEIRILLILTVILYWYWYTEKWLVLTEQIVHFGATN